MLISLNIHNKKIFKGVSIYNKNSKIKLGDIHKFVVCSDYDNSGIIPKDATYINDAMS